MSRYIYTQDIRYLVMPAYIYVDMWMHSLRVDVLVSVSVVVPSPPHVHVVMDVPM